MYYTNAAISCLAVVSHIGIFKRIEPSPFSFVGYLIISNATCFIGLITISHTSFNQAIQLLAVWSTLYLAFTLFSVLAYRLSPWHPLAAIPGPKLAATSKWWMVYRILVKGGRHLYLQRLHQEYGTFVRVGPNEVSVNSSMAVKTIYALDRAAFYEGTPAKADSLITVVDRERHTRRRQAWVRAVTGDLKYSYITPAQKRVDQLIDILHQQSNGINLDHWFNLFFMDLMGDMGFSGGFETMKAGKDTEKWLEMLANGVIFVSAMGQVPWLKSIFQLLPQPGPLASFHKFTENKIKEIQSTPNKVLRRDMLSIILDTSSGATPLTQDEAAADATLVVVAATDTSVQAVLTFFRYIATDKSRQEKLQREIDEVFSPLTGELDVNSLLVLPYLDACIQEALRIMPPGPFGPPRKTGAGGLQLLGRWIPPKTTLHVPVFAMHRDPRNFGTLSNTFVPERWLQEQETRPGKDKGNKTTLFLCNRDAFVPFSTGYSSCAGKHLALQNIKILVAKLLYTFNIIPSPDFDPEAFDKSYKEYGLWTHDPLKVRLTSRHGDSSKLV